MPTYQEIETAIIDTLHASGAFPGGCVGRWAGQVDELATNPKRLPSAWVAYQGGKHSEPLNIGRPSYEKKQGWVVILFLSTLRSGISLDADIYVPVAAVEKALTGLAIGGAELWPVGDQLIDSAPGVAVYEVRFTITTGEG